MLVNRNSLSSEASSTLEGCKNLQQPSTTQIIHLKHNNVDLVNKILELQRRVESLQPLSDKYRSIFENAVAGIYQTTADGRFLLANPALARIYGYESPAQLVTNLADISRQLYVNPERQRQLIELLQEKERVSGFESEVYRQDGSIIWICENVGAVRDESGVLLYCEGFVTDITERKLAEARWRESVELCKKQAEQIEQMQSQLMQSEKLSSLGQMVAGVAHELNNPVTFVCGNLIYAGQYAEDVLTLLKLYHKYYPDPVPEIAYITDSLDLEFMMADFKKTLSSMQIGADRIRQIIHSLRNFSRMDEVKMKPGNLHEGIDSTLLILNNRLKASPQNQEIKIIKEYGNLPLLHCYCGLLNQVFMNLLSNAIDALDDQRKFANSSSKNPQIRISTEVKNNTWVVVRIADNGHGMPEKVKEQIFNPFFTTKPVGKGTGLGLSISYQIVVEKHGGKLECISDPEQGTEFAIAIPMRL